MPSTPAATLGFGGIDGGERLRLTLIEHVAHVGVAKTVDYDHGTFSPAFDSWRAAISLAAILIHADKVRPHMRAARSKAARSAVSVRTRNWRGPGSGRRRFADNISGV